MNAAAIAAMMKNTPTPMDQRNTNRIMGGRLFSYKGSLLCLIGERCRYGGWRVLFRRNVKNIASAGGAPDDCMERVGGAEPFTAPCRRAGDDQLLSSKPLFLLRREGISVGNALQSGLLSSRAMRPKATRPY